ncbi:MAG: hypothetical protein JJT75_06130 [Opitutales bacterium]|nr:hypothetical protein [Opitutales bacterium]MCH8539556.1 hypothetical protein [Opitutales bacterium]
MIRLFSLSLLLPALTFPTIGAGQSSEVREILTLLSAEWNMQERPRGFPTFLEMHQEGNKIPTYWAGRFTGDMFQLSPDYDILSGEVQITSTGEFTAQFKNTAPRLGMRDIVPGGPWAEEPGEEGIRVTIKEITDWQYPIPGEEPNPEDVRAQAKFTGTFRVHDEEAALSGPVHFLFNTETGAFTLRAESTLVGKEAGLKDPHEGPIQLTFHLQSATPAPIALPDPDIGMEEDDLDMPGF